MERLLHLGKDDSDEEIIILVNEDCPDADFVGKGWKIMGVYPLPIEAWDGELPTNLEMVKRA